MDWATGLHKDGSADLTVCWCLRGLLWYPEAQAFARAMPPDWWPGGFPRAMAAALIAGTHWPLSHPGIAPWAPSLADALERGGYPDTPEQALRHLRQLAVLGQARAVEVLRARRAAVKQEETDAYEEALKARRRASSIQEKIRHAEDLVFEMQQQLQE